MFKTPLYHCRPKGSRPAAVPSTSKIRSKMNVWGGICYYGPTNFVCFDWNMDSKFYRRILADSLVPFVLENNIPYVHQDNDKKHRSELCMEILNVFKIDWVCLLSD